MTISRRTIQRRNATAYDARRIKMSGAAAVNGSEATSTSTARPTPPTKRCRKPKAVPYSKRIGLEKEERESVAAVVSTARTAARAKLRGNSHAVQVSVSDDIATIPTGRKKSNLNPRHGTRLNPIKPARLVKPIEKYVAEPACCFKKSSNSRSP